MARIPCALRAPGQPFCQLRIACQRKVLAGKPLKLVVQKIACERAAHEGVTRTRVGRATLPGIAVCRGVAARLGIRGEIVRFAILSRDWAFIISGPGRL